MVLKALFREVLVLVLAVVFVCDSMWGPLLIRCKRRVWCLRQNPQEPRPRIDLVDPAKLSLQFLAFLGLLNDKVVATAEVWVAVPFLVEQDGLLIFAV